MFVHLTELNYLGLSIKETNLKRLAKGISEITPPAFGVA